MTINDETLFQLPHVPVGNRILFKQHRRYYSVLQGVMGVVLSLPEVCGVLVGTPGVSLDLFFRTQEQRVQTHKYVKKLFDTNNILCLQEVHGKDECLQAIQVLAPRFRFFLVRFPGNENAGGSAICIHRDFLPEEAIVTHFLSRP